VCDNIHVGENISLVVDRIGKLVMRKQRMNIGQILTKIYNGYVFNPFLFSNFRHFSQAERGIWHLPMISLTSVNLTKVNVYERGISWEDDYRPITVHFLPRPRLPDRFSGAIKCSQT